MHTRSRLNEVHPVKLLRTLPRIRAGNTRIPLVIRITRIAITVRSQRLCQPVAVLAVHQFDHVAVDIVIDELVAMLRLGQPFLNRSVGTLDDIAPGVDAAAVRAEILGCDWSSVLGVDVRDEDVRCALLDQVLRMPRDFLRDGGSELGVLRVALPEGVGMLGQIILTGPDELQRILYARRGRVGIVPADLVVH